ncbi:MAG: asparagine synthetase B [Candidatus Bathyarchaeota archaeon]|nr:MAG: asparagine synthetase B [Candidatus Bathyarchaeota archaeon]
MNKKGEDAIPTVLSMLIQLKHRGTDAHGVATPNFTRTANSIDQISTKSMSSDVALGHNLSLILPKDHPQPVLGENHALAFEGRIFPPFGVSDVDAIQNTLGSDPQKNVHSIIKRFDGPYTFAIACQDVVIAGRDILGIAPLYYGENETIAAIASERKALWQIGIETAESFPPGSLASISRYGFKFKPIRTFVQPSRKPMYMKPAAGRLQTLLLESMKKRLSDTKKAAVAFSGGLDSSIVAALAKLCTVEVQLITVGLKGQRELEHARTAAKILELPLHVQAYTLNDVEQALPKVLWLIEEPDVMKAEIAIPLFWTAEIAAKLGFRILLAGQGADELFGGYQRYLKDYAADVEVMRDSMYHDVITCYEKNFQRDNQVCSFHKVELRLPFADREVASFSLGLPARLKIESSEDPLRKRVLRLTAENLGQPESIARRPKKAIQYATGVNRALRRLARVEGSTLREYVKRCLREAYRKR